MRCMISKIGGRVRSLGGMGSEMANKLAGQRAKFSRARAIFYTTSDEGQRRRAAELMAEVLAEAPANGFAEAEVTQGEDVPGEARDLIGMLSGSPSADDPDELVAALSTTVDTSTARRVGDGNEFVYAYGYRCAPDRLKIGRSTVDAVARIAAQISTGTPDKPVLLVEMRTHDSGALERALHGMFRLNGRQIAGAGAEWFVATAEEVLDAYGRITA